VNPNGCDSDRHWTLNLSQRYRDEADLREASLMNRDRCGRKPGASGIPAVGSCG
jgi:hypothetical protein